MPAQTERLLWRFINGLRAGQKSASGAFTEFSNVGYQTMTGCARAARDLYIRPKDFDVAISSSKITGGCNNGSMFGASLLLSVTGSIFVGTTGSPTVTALNMGVGASPASPLSAVALVEKPTDAATSGSIIAYVDWTYGAAPATTGSKVAFQFGLGYLGTGAATSAVRTAASTGGVGVASYNGTTCGLIQSTCLGKLPSWAASDVGAVVVLQVGASAAADSGVLSTGCVYVLGVRLRYLVDRFGIQSTE